MKEIQGLNWLRGTAALLVLLSHARPLFYENYATLQNPSFIDKLFYLVTGLGSASVMVFFVLSGYLVAGSAHRAAERGHWSWRDYLLRRLSRLWAVLLPCLLLTLLCDHVGSSILGSSFYDGALTDSYSSGPNGISDHSFTTFLGNLFFLHEIFVPTYGSNGPLWSISYEFWYYILYPMLMLAAWSGRSFLSRVLNIVVCLCIALIIGKDIVLLFPVWLLGFGSWYMRNSRLSLYLKSTPLAGLAVILTLVLFMLVTRALRLDIIGGSYLLGLLVSLGIPALHHPWFSKGGRLGKFFSDISYSLYLTHFPILALLAAAQGNDRSNDVIGDMPQFILWLVISGLVATAFYISFEKRTPTLRAGLDAILPKF